MIDGTVARRTGSVSEFGSKLDTDVSLNIITRHQFNLLVLCGGGYSFIPHKNLMILFKVNFRFVLSYNVK